MSIVHEYKLWIVSLSEFIPHSYVVFVVLIKVHVLTIIFLQFSRSLIVVALWSQGQPKNIMADMAGDGSVDKAVAFDQEHSELVLNVDWWWAVHICLCAIAVVANLIFIITVIHNRYETSSDFYFIQLVQLLNLRHFYVNWVHIE